MLNFEKFYKETKRLNGFDNNAGVIRNFINPYRLFQSAVVETKNIYFKDLYIEGFIPDFSFYNETENGLFVLDKAIYSDAPFIQLANFIGNVNVDVLNLESVQSGFRFVPNFETEVVSETEYYSPKKEFVIFAPNDNEIIDVDSDDFEFYFTSGFAYFHLSSAADKTQTFTIKFSAAGNVLVKVNSFDNDKFKFGVI